MTQTNSYLLQHASRISRLLQLDSTLAYALGMRIWQAVSGPITLALLLEFLTVPEQGVYYSIVGVVGIQAYFELGLLSVLVRQASHESAVLRRPIAETAAEDIPIATARMQALIRSSTRWFSIGAIFYVIASLLFGWSTLRESQVIWEGPLAVVILASAATVAVSPSLSILEGAGHRAMIFRIRLVQALLGTIAVWCSLMFGLKLWTLGVAAAVQTLVSLYVRFFATAQFWKQFRDVTPAASTSFSWTREILPSQWRIALISVGFHFATQFFVVIVVMFHGDSAGAALGVTLTITNAIQMLAAAWVQSKYAVVSEQIAAGHREEAGTAWRQTAVVSTSVLLLMTLGFAVAVASLPLFYPRYVDRFLSPVQIILIGIGNLAGHVASLQGFYVLARKGTPLLAASLIGALTTAVAVWIGGCFFASTGVVAAYALTMSCVLVPVHTLAYARFRDVPDEPEKATVP